MLLQKIYRSLLIVFVGFKGQLKVLSSRIRCWLVAYPNFELLYRFQISFDGSNSWSRKSEGLLVLLYASKSIVLSITQFAKNLHYNHSYLVRVRGAYFCNLARRLQDAPVHDN